ncbi:hypothetical protein, partial [Pseudomonas fluorescens]|uniref:hypothetical protein n=1 Tax=Pseudomonas fluorescens TaxID=294 RepID=UPI001C9D91F3
TPLATKCLPAVSSVHQFVTERPSVAQYHVFMTFRFFPKNLLQKIHASRQPFYDGAFRRFVNLS